jgi:hypothetical protein
VTASDRIQVQAPPPETPAQPPPQPEALVRSITGLAARLCDIMIKETALLEAGRASEIAALTLEKNELSRAYAGRWAQLKAIKNAVAALPAPVLDGLRQQVTRLAVIAAENEKALRIIHNATDRVLGIIMKAIRDQHQAGKTYSKGRIPARRLPPLRGVALNRTL